MEQNNDLKALTQALKEYRDLLVPVQESLSDIVEAYGAIKSDLDELNTTFDDGVREKLDKIYSALTGQAKKSEELTIGINDFMKKSDRYTAELNSATAIFKEARERLNAMAELEEKAREQLSRLDALLEEKKSSYNIKDLQKSLDGYNLNVQKISEYINKEIAASIQNNSKEIERIKQSSEKIEARLEAEHTDIVALANAIQTESELLKKVVENGDVNEAYLFDALDRWAISRKIKIKK